jgi:GNAT superfamily N-acetyltransferase
MRIEQWDPADDLTARAVYDLMCAATAVDEPVAPPPSYELFKFDIREGWDPQPGETWVARGDDDAVVGYYRIRLPDLENLDEAYGSPVVHPAVRRRGIGRELLRHEGARARAHDRTRFGGQTAAGAAGDAFARAVGARLDLAEARRVQYLREIEPGTVDTLHASALQASAGYSLVSWDGPIPEKYSAAVAGVMNAFNDAPHGDNEQPALWDADRVRERLGKVARAGLVRSHNVAAIRDSTGEMVGYTEIVVDCGTPTWGYQEVTAVVKAHRGHRLGLLVKTEMLSLLAAAEPQVEQIETGNAAVNKYMIAVNEQLGYRVVEPGWNVYEMPVADMA